MNKDYYEFVFISDQGKNINVKIANAIETYNVSTFATDMDTIINSNIILTSKGKPIAKRLAKFISPKVVDITVQNNS